MVSLLLLLLLLFCIKMPVGKMLTKKIHAPVLFNKENEIVAWLKMDLSVSWRGRVDICHPSILQFVAYGLVVGTINLSTTLPPRDGGLLHF